MCGITALFLTRPLQDPDVALGAQATYDLRHRGPDASGNWVDHDAGVFLGHRRLSVIDVSSASNQPMINHGHVLTYNGELYNYRAVRERLRGLGHKFSTAGDTEVLMAAWRQFGPEALDAFEGMFAFALWDGNDGWLATDRYGEKPLFYATTPDGLVVSSELPTLVRMIGAKPSISQFDTAAFMALGFFSGPNTIYPSIKRVPPATLIRISDGKIIYQRNYWRPPFGEPGRGPIDPISEQGLDRIEGALLDSVALRLESDVPTCLYLSAGIDSSLIAAMAAKSLDRKLDAITVKFSEGSSPDESKDAENIAAELGLQHESIENQDDPQSVNPDYLFGLVGQPAADLSLASAHQMASAGAAQGFKVGLTGMGGDEVAYGYNKYAFAFDHRRILNSPEWVRLWLGQVLRAIQGFSSVARTFQYAAGVKDFELLLAIKNFPAIQALRGIPGFSEWASQTFPRSNQRLEFEIPKFELESAMTWLRLPSWDVSSMRASIEFRTPFLSRPLQETMASFDPRSLLKFGQKSVLRRILKRYLPDHLVDFPKRGLIFPPDRFGWMRTDQAPETKNLPADVAKTIWQNRSKHGWRSIATRSLMLSEFEKWVPGNLPQAPSSSTSNLHLASDHA